MCLRVFSNSVAAVESQDTQSSKSCFRCCFQEQEKTPEVRGIYFKVTFPSLLFGTRVSSSLCRRAGLDPQSEMGAVRGCPSGAACRLEKEQARGRRGRRGKRVLLHSEECRHQRDRRPEPTVKAQHVFGTNKLAGMAARWGGPFSHWFKKTETKLEKTIGKALWLAALPPTTSGVCLAEMDAP